MLYFLLTWLAGPLLRLRIALGGRRPGPRRVLLIQTAKIGDLICTTPVIASLKASWPDCRLTVMVSPVCAPLLAHDPSVDTLWPVPAGDWRGFAGRASGKADQQRRGLPQPDRSTCRTATARTRRPSGSVDARRRLRAKLADQLHRAADRQDDARAVRLVAAQMDSAMRRLRVLVLMHPDFVPPDSTKGYTAQQINEWKTEYDVVSTLRAAGHEVVCVVRRPEAAGVMAHIFRVGEITRALKDVIEGQFPFVWVRGQVSNLSKPPSGHLYFSLKDDDATLNVVWFKGAQPRAEEGERVNPLTGEVETGPVFQLVDGLEVLVAGRMNVYPPRGAYQLVAELVQGQGLGEAVHEEAALGHLGQFVVARQALQLRLIGLAFADVAGQAQVAVMIHADFSDDEAGVAGTDKARTDGEGRGHGGSGMVEGGRHYSLTPAAVGRFDERTAAVQYAGHAEAPCPVPCSRRFRPPDGCRPGTLVLHRSRAEAPRVGRSGFR